MAAIYTQYTIEARFDYDGDGRLRTKTTSARTIEEAYRYAQEYETRDGYVSVRVIDESGDTILARHVEDAA